MLKPFSFRRANIGRLQAGACECLAPAARESVEQAPGSSKVIIGGQREETGQGGEGGQGIEISQGAETGQAAEGGQGEEGGQRHGADQGADQHNTRLGQVRHGHVAGTAFWRDKYLTKLCCQGLSEHSLFLVISFMINH